jgi:short-subunit dehydrogenase
MRFDNRVVFITGASTGIGRAMALEFARRGAKVGVVARRLERLEELCQEIRSHGGTAACVAADITNREQTLAALSQLREKLGPCDIVVANAGVGCTNTGTDLNVAATEMLFHTNLFGPLYTIEGVLSDMVTRGSGQIVGISSIASYKGLPGSAAYCASKSALSAYLESLRISLRSKGIAVTTICPGFILTPMTEHQEGMLWVLTPEVAATKIIDAIGRRKKVYSFPRRMRWLIGFTRWLPDRMLARFVPH